MPVIKVVKTMQSINLMRSGKEIKSTDGKSKEHYQVGSVTMYDFDSTDFKVIHMNGKEDDIFELINKYNLIVVGS